MTAGPPILGLDIGGANLKAAHTDGTARSRPFPLWKNPGGLTDALRALLAELPPADVLAVTMSGELCDCFESKRQGVHFILDAVGRVAAGRIVRVWRTDERFSDVATARAEPLRVAAANWLALASYAGRFAPPGPALLIDIGSTTTDIIPLVNGKPVPQGRTDPERLRSGELVYTGVRRTPACALGVPGGMAAELFATTLDVWLLLGEIEEDPSANDTADGRPATVAAAHARLARMLGADLETSTEKERRDLAELLASLQTAIVSGHVEAMARQFRVPLAGAVVAGEGEFLALRALAREGGTLMCPAVRLSERLGPHRSRAACAYAVAALAAEAV
jgi:probable H4MPT-linked C1 transfer pathway protein